MIIVSPAGNVSPGFKLFKFNIQNILNSIVGTTLRMGGGDARLSTKEQCGVMRSRILHLYHLESRVRLCTHEADAFIVQVALNGVLLSKTVL
jgi:hypothetical protein